MKRFLVIVLLSFSIVVVFHHASAQGLQQDTELIEKARVTAVVSQERKNIPGTETPADYQTLRAHVLDGVDAGKDITVENDYLKLKPGDVFYVSHNLGDVEGIESYTVFEPYRMNVLYILLGLFVLCVVIFGGKQGIRGLCALIASFLFIVYLLLPGILHGYSPILVSVGVASLIVILGSYVTHGFNKTTTAAVIGMLVTIAITGLLAYISVHAAHFTGFNSEETVYLNLNANGKIDLVGVLLGSIIIGLLGILYDAAIGQAIAIEELHHIGPHLSRTTIYQRAIRIGREHIGALVNTLAIAYVGAFLPLLLLFYSYTSTATTSLAVTINRELFATEIVRIVVGSIGLILAVPITTVICVAFLVRPKKTTDHAIVQAEEHALKAARHSH